MVQYVFGNMWSNDCFCNKFISRIWFFCYWDYSWNVGLKIKAPTRPQIEQEFGLMTKLRYRGFSTVHTATTMAIKIKHSTQALFLYWSCFCDEINHVAFIRNAMNELDAENRSGSLTEGQAGSHWSDCVIVMHFNVLEQWSKSTESASDITQHCTYC